MDNNDFLKALGQLHDPSYMREATGLNRFLEEHTEMLRAIEASPGPQSFTYADTQYEIIKQYIQDFQASLDNEHDVGLLLTNFGHSVMMEVTDISYEESVLMVFHGFVNGQRATLIQHVSQLNFLLTTVPKSADQPHRQIGFRTD